MKKSRQKLLIMTLVVAFSLAAVMCCCVPDALYAEEEVASCHQTTGSHDPAQSADDCECDDTLAILTEKADDTIDCSTKLFIVLNANASEFVSHFSYKVVYQIPPPVIDTSPLYIKNAVLLL